MLNKIMDTAPTEAYDLPKALLIIFICIAFMAGCTSAESPFKSDVQVTQDNTETNVSQTPVKEAPSSAAGKKLEGNITAYDELKPAARAVLEHVAKEPGFPYGIVVYEQTEFDGGALVLAGGLHDGENHPELYFVDKENSIRSYTTGSDCWELNFTELSGRRVYYGICGVTALQVTFGYGDASASAAPHSPGVIAVKNVAAETDSFIKNVQGYIIVTDRKDLPFSLEILKEDGESVNITEYILKGTPIPPYEDVEEPSIRYYSLYRFNRMAEPGDADFAGKIGHISLQSGKCGQELEYAGCFKDVPLQELFKSLSVYALCSNYMYESQSLPAGGKAKLVLENGYPKDVKIRCYFSELTSGMWNKFKTNGGLSFLRTFTEPDSDGNIALFDKQGYYFIVMCAEDPSVKSGTLTYAGVINLD